MSRHTIWLLVSIGVTRGAYAQGGIAPAFTYSDSVEAIPDTTPDSVHVHHPMPTAGPQVGRAFVEIVLLNGAAVAINHLARDLPMTRPETWWRNLRGGWTWDGNNISTNNIEHPYGGAVYYNVARANGLSFWAAAPVTASGSLMWELFGEPVPPSPNDLIITSLSGITLGEATRQLSLMVLDNQARGLSRVWREAAVLLFNPGLGVDRLSRGQTWQQRPNPPDHHPSTMRTTVAIGAKRMTRTDAAPSIDLAAAAVEIQVGDPFKEKVGPFSTFTFTAQLNSGPSTTVAEVGTRGILAALGRRDGPTRQVVGIFMDFDYQWNVSYQFSEQSFGLGWLSRAGGQDWRLDTDISAELLPLMASSDTHTRPLLGRPYDYGSGVGGRAFIHFDHRDFRIISAGYRGFWTATVSGASETKLVQFATVEARAPLPLGLAVGASYTMYRQRSTYDILPTSIVSLPSWSVFISSAGR